MANDHRDQPLIWITELFGTKQTQEKVEGRTEMLTVCIACEIRILATYIVHEIIIGNGSTDSNETRILGITFYIILFFFLLI